MSSRLFRVLIAFSLCFLLVGATSASSYVTIGEENDTWPGTVEEDRNNYSIENDSLELNESDIQEFGENETSGNKIEGNSGGESEFFQGNFFDIELRFNNESFSLESIEYEVDEYTGGVISQHPRGTYAVRLTNSEGDIKASQNFLKHENLFFKIETGIRAEYLEIQNDKGDILRRWFIPNRICLGENLPDYCEVNGYGNRIDEVNLTRGQLDWPEECRESSLTEALSSGSYSGSTKSDNLFLPVRADKGENATVKFKMENGGLSSVDVLGENKKVIRGNLKYFRTWKPFPENYKPVILSDKKEDGGVVCYRFNFKEGYSNNWTALVKVGEEPEWLYNGKKNRELNITTGKSGDSEKLKGNLNFKLSDILDLFNGLAGI